MDTRPASRQLAEGGLQEEEGGEAAATANPAPGRPDLLAGRILAAPRRGTRAGSLIAASRVSMSAATASSCGR